MICAYNDAADAIAERTEAQHLYVQALCQKHRVTTAMLDACCEQRWDRPYRLINRYETSELIDEMKTWKQAPAELLRLAGQLDLFGLEGVG